MAENVCVSAEATLPKLVSKDEDSLLSRLELLRQKGTTEQGLDSQQLEQSLPQAQPGHRRERPCPDERGEQLAVRVPERAELDSLEEMRELPRRVLAQSPAAGTRVANTMLCEGSSRTFTM